MKSGFAAILGMANVGKSTLVNNLLGEKISIVSHKPQTTRENILGVLNGDDYQIVLIDTPGKHRADSLLGSFMNDCIASAANSVDCIVLVVDSQKGIRDVELRNIAEYKKLNVPLIVALNKVDLIEKQTLMPMLSRLASEELAAIVPISALRKDNLTALTCEIKKNLKGTELLYPLDILTDKSNRYMVKEIIREKILSRYNAEVPHGISIVLNKYEYSEERGLFEIDADIVCERKSHKSIIIGSGGEALKNVGTKARADIEKLLEQRVYLTLWVRVKEKWKDSQMLLSEYGYDKRELE